MCSFDGRWTWSIPLTTSLRGGALLEWEHLCHSLEELPVNFLTAGPASIIWPLETSSVFSVKSMRSVLTYEKFPGLLEFPADMVWNKSVPTKVQSFCWMVFHGKIASVDNLQRRGMQMANRCVLCCRCIETVDHIMLHCAFSTKVWNLIGSALSIHGPGQAEVCDFIRSWKGMNCSPPFNDAIIALMQATFWCLWLERNSRIFKDKVSLSRQVFARIVTSVGNWSRAAFVFSAEKQLFWNRFAFDNG
ncbi:Putative ribonuclease H protein At1g65750 [Linum grandiflorum]